MFGKKMFGLIIILLGLSSVAFGTILYTVEPPVISNGTFCGSLCLLEKAPIYCYKTLHGILFDVGWLLTITGSCLMFLYRKQKLIEP